MNWNEKLEARLMRISLKLAGIQDTTGMRFALFPKDGNVVDLVDAYGGFSVGEFEIEEGETLQELADCLEPLLPGAKVMVPTVGV